jgi:hypothetical protein
VIAFIDN